jgi:hypothetical protein
MRPMTISFNPRHEKTYPTYISREARKELSPKPRVESKRERETHLLIIDDEEAIPPHGKDAKIEEAIRCGEHP